MTGVRRVLFASDFSKRSGKAFATAVKMARTNRATLTVLHVIPPPVPISLSADGLTVDGRPAHQIVRVARSKRFDLVVIGTHGRAGLAKFFLGSVAGRVVSTAPCPVLTVPG